MTHAARQEAAERIRGLRYFAVAFVTSSGSIMPLSHTVRRPSSKRLRMPRGLGLKLIGRDADVALLLRNDDIERHQPHPAPDPFIGAGYRRPVIARDRQLELRIELEEILVQLRACIGSPPVTSFTIASASANFFGFGRPKHPHARQYREIRRRLPALRICHDRGRSRSAAFRHSRQRHATAIDQKDLPFALP